MADPNLQITIGATDQTRAAFEAVQAQMKRTEAQANQLGSAAVRTQGSMRSLGSVTQQAGFQVQDFAAQVAGGQSALVAFAQNAPQFLGVFGAGGALAGAAVAVGAVALQIWNAVDAAESARTVFDDLTDEVAKFNKEAEKLARGDVRVRAQVQVEDFSEQIRMLEELRDEAIAQQAGGISGELPMLGLPSVSQLEGRIKELRQKMQDFDRAVMRREAEDMQAANIRRGGEEFAEQRERERKAAEEAARKMLEYQRSVDAYNRSVMQTVLSLDPVEAATQRYNQQLDHLGAALRAGEIDQEKYNDLVREAQRRLIDATDKVDRHAEALDRQADALRQQLDPMHAYQVELEKLNELLETGRISTEEYGQAADRAWQRVNRTQDDTQQVARDLGLTFNSAFEDAIVRGEKFRNVLAGIAQDIARIMIRRTVTERLGGFATDALGSIGRMIFGGGGTVGAALGPVDLGLPGFANGGPVSGGRPIIVGEEGPEIFVPHSAGQIVPNGQSVGGGVTVHQTINISAGVAQTVRAEVLGMLPRIKRETLDAVADARMRGGSFASAMGT